MKLSIENKSAKNIRSINFKGKNIAEALQAINANQDKLTEYEMGRGGNHIWFADKNTGDRVAILTNE